MVTQFSRFARRAVYNFKTKCVSAEIAAICKMRVDRVSSSPQSKNRAEADLYIQSPDRLRQGLTPAPSVRIGGFGLPVVASKKFDQCVALQAIAPSFVSRQAESFPCVIPTRVREVEGPGFRPRANWHCLNPTRLSPFPHGKGVGVSCPESRQSFQHHLSSCHSKSEATPLFYGRRGFVAARRSGEDSANSGFDGCISRLRLRALPPYVNP